MLLEALDLHRLVAVCAEGPDAMQALLAASQPQQIDSLLQDWLPSAQPAHAPILLAWAAAALLAQSLCPGIAKTYQAAQAHAQELAAMHAAVQYLLLQQCPLRCTKYISM